MRTNITFCFITASRTLCLQMENIVVARMTGSGSNEFFETDVLTGDESSSSSADMRSDCQFLHDNFSDPLSPEVRSDHLDLVADLNSSQAAAQNAQVMNSA